MSLNHITKDAMLNIDQHYKNKYKVKKLFLFLTTISLCISILFINIESVYSSFLKAETFEMLILKLITITFSITLPFTYMIIYIINILKKFKNFNQSLKYTNSKFEQLLQTSKIFKYIHNVIWILTIFMLVVYTIYSCGVIYKIDFEFTFIPILLLIFLVIKATLSFISLFVVAFTPKISKDLNFDLKAYADEVRRNKKANSNYRQRKNRNIEKTAKVAVRKGNNTKKVSDETKTIRKVDVKDIY